MGSFVLLLPVKEGKSDAGKSCEKQAAQATPIGGAMTCRSGTQRKPFSQQFPLRLEPFEKYRV